MKIFGEHSYFQKFTWSSQWKCENQQQKIKAESETKILVALKCKFFQEASKCPKSFVKRKKKKKSWI